LANIIIFSDIIKMADKVIAIVDYPFSRPSVISAIKVKIHSVVLFTSVTLMVQLLDASSKIIDVKQLILSGDEYLGWGNDDKYLIDIAIVKLGFVAVA
jgi:hypothetical protein